MCMLRGPYSTTGMSDKGASDAFGVTGMTQVSEEAEAEEAEEAEESNHKGVDISYERRIYPPNLNLASLWEATPGVWSMRSDEQSLANIAGLLQRRQHHIEAWKWEKLRKVQGWTVLPPLEVSHETNLCIQPTVGPAASQAAGQAASRQPSSQPSSQPASCTQPQHVRGHCSPDGRSSGAHRQAARHWSQGEASGEALAQMLHSPDIRGLPCPTLNIGRAQQPAEQSALPASQVLC
jgi:hypothetical protein